MDIMEMASELGRAIYASDEMKAFLSAKEAYLKDPEIGTLMKEYSVQKIALENQQKEKDPDPAFTDAINKRIAEICKDIEANGKMDAYVKAEDTLNAFMNKINAAITAELTVGEENGCSPEHCASCSGCGHKH